ncbi:C4-dicarboxylate TRAP transporter substrate-binding protein [Roseibium sp.]|uniref:C4-dicarboxylate TRAP transporter substrate-binding protein n=1 Tax=Roseibium sp. TaxID=1936156 RepID=UPI003A987705
MKRLMIGAVAAACLAVSAQAEDLRVSPGVPSAHPAYSHGYAHLLKYLPEESNGALTATLIGPEVVSLGQMKEALQAGVTQVGLLLPLYFPADFPYLSIPSEVALVGTSPDAMGAAMTEFVVTCEPCQKELKAFGAVFLGSGSTDIYHLLTTKPVTSLEDLKGLRLRSGGAPWSRFAEAFGAVPVSMPVGETFEAMSQGAIDGTATSYGDLLSFRLVEVTKDINTINLGTYHATSYFTVNGQTWAGLKPEDRAALARAANRANADTTLRWAHELTAAATAAAEKAGIKFIDPPADMAEAVKAYAAKDAEAVAKLYAERDGIEEADAMVKRFLTLVDKWNGIVAETGPDAEAIAAKVQEEVWSKVDYSTYGL